MNRHGLSPARKAIALNRRTLLSAACALPLSALPLGRSAAGAEGALPLRNLGLEHLDVLVPDTARSALFYMQVFDAPLHEQEFRGTIRYFVLLGDLPEDRQVGYIAIGDVFDRPIQIGHYCALAEDVDLDAIGEELVAAGYPPPGGGFGMIPDPDGLELQLFSPPRSGLVGAATKSPLEHHTGGLFRPVGMDHILLRVSDLDQALEYYRFVYGEGLERRDPNVADKVWLELPEDTRIGLQPVPPGRDPWIERYGIKVEPFDHDAAVAGLRELGAEVLSGPDEPEVVTFKDNYDITLQVTSR